MLLMRAASITWASERGFGPGNLYFAFAYRLGAISQGPKKSLDFQGPTPSHLPASKSKAL